MTQGLVARGHVASRGTGWCFPESRVRVCVCMDIARRHGEPGFGGTRPCRLWRHGTVLSRVTRKGSFWESLLLYK